MHKSKEEVYRTYHSFNTDIAVKTALLNALDLCQYKPDFIYKKTDNSTKVEFPWVNDTLIAKITDPVIKGAVEEFKKARKKIEDEIKKDPTRFFDMFSEYETSLLREYHEKIFESPQATFKIVGELVNVNSTKEFLTYMNQLKEKGKIHHFVPPDIPNTVERGIVSDIFVEESKYKDCMINLTVEEKTQTGGMEFTVWQGKNGFARCEALSFEPHYFCHENCKFELGEEKSVRTHNCFGIINSMIFLQKIKKTGRKYKNKRDS